LSIGDGLQLHFVSFASPLDGILNKNLFISPSVPIRPVAKFIVPDREDKVDSGIGMSHRPASICRLPGLYNNPMPE
jgi:hypothetical protein